VPDVLPRPDRLDAIDRALVARCADGDLPALQALFSRHGGTVRGCAEVAARRRGAPAADDLVTAAFVTVWEQARAVLTGSRSVEAVLVVAVARLGLGRPALG
jgi:DNA-directed RNA polymerase specialized sigma24 family protein